MKSKAVCCLSVSLLFLPSCANESDLGSTKGSASAGAAKSTVVETFSGTGILTVDNPRRTRSTQAEAFFTLDRTSFAANPGVVTFSGGSVDFSSDQLQAYFLGHPVTGHVTVTNGSNPEAALDFGVTAGTPFAVAVEAECPPQEPVLAAMPPVGALSTKSTFSMGARASESRAQADFAEFGNLTFHFLPWTGTPNAAIKALNGYNVDLVYNNIRVTSRDIVNQIFGIAFDGEVVVVE